VLGEHHLAGRMDQYPLIVVPEWEYLEPPFKDQLIAYVRAGGNLLLVGPKTAALFQAELGVTFQGQPKPSGTIYLADGNGISPTKGETQAVTLSPSATAFVAIHQTNDPASPSQPAASIMKLGRGRIAATYFTLGQTYTSAPTPALRAFLNGLVRQLFPKPMVEVAGSPDVDVCVARNHGKLLVNLVNTSGPHRTQSIVNAIAPIGPLAVTIRQPTRPARVTLEPAAKPLPFDYRNGEIALTVPRVEIHEVIVVEP
jgi:hypothetical protein